MSYTVPKGPLVSFGAFNFNQKRSKLLSWSLVSPDESIDLIGSVQQVDLAGYADIALHGVYTWSYAIICNGGSSIQGMQDEVTSLVNALHTRNGDGTTGQVALLTAKLAGYSTAVATGIARLLKVESMNTYPTREDLSLTFLCPQGLLY